MRSARLGAVLAVAALFSQPEPAAGAVLGPQRVLTVLATFGSQPFPASRVASVLRGADAFVRKASYGQTSLQTQVTPWLTVPTAPQSCADDPGHTAIPIQIIAPLRDVAALAGYRPSAYDRVIYVVTGTNCRFRGAAEGAEILLVGEPDTPLVVHELGHTFGLSHAQASPYCAVWCVTQEEGDVFSPMGSGFTDFSSYEKVQLGWIPPQTPVTRAGRYLLYPVARPTRRRAIVISTAEGDYWLEQSPDRSVPGLVVRVVHPETAPLRSAAAATLLLSPVRVGRPTVGPGETFRVPGGFAVRLARTRATPARVDLRPLGAHLH